MRKPSTHGGVSNTRRVFLEYDLSTEGESPASIIAKFPLQTDESLFKGKVNIGKVARLFESEVKFYQNAPDMDFLPKVYYSEIDTSQNFNILMEDCSTIKLCAEEGDENKIAQSMSVDQAKKALSKFACFHAKYYHLRGHDLKERNIKQGNGSKFLQEKGWGWVPERFARTYTGMQIISSEDESKIFGGYCEENVQFMQKKIQELWDKLLPFFLDIDFTEMGYGDLEIPKKLQDMQENKTKMVQDYGASWKYLVEEAPVTLNHGDCGKDNMIFSKDDQQLKVFDWQAICVGNGFYDVVYLIYMSLTPRDIIQNEKHLIQVYLMELQKKGITLISEEEAQKMYRAALLWFLGMTLGFALLISSIPKEQRLSQKTIVKKCMDCVVAVASSKFISND